MFLSGRYSADNGNKDIVLIQLGDLVLVNWTEENPYWNHASGTVVNGKVSMSFGDSEQFTGRVPNDGGKIVWENGSSWTRDPTESLEIKPD